MLKLQPASPLSSIRAASLLIIGMAALTTAACSGVYQSRSENVVGADNAMAEFEGEAGAIDLDDNAIGEESELRPGHAAPPLTGTDPMDDDVASEGSMGGREAAGHASSNSARGVRRSRARADDSLAEGPVGAPELVFCEILGDQATKPECDLYGQIWNSLKTGAGGIEFPDKMVRGETRTASFAISRNKGVSTEILIGRAPDKEFELKVGRRMAALLQGEGFAIDPKSMVYKDLHIGQGARWDWQVTALKGSTHSLTLSAYVVVNSPDNKGTETLLKSHTQEIPVTVTWAQWYSDLAESVANFSATTKTLLAALVALLVAVSLFRKQLIAFLQEFRKKST